MDKQLVEKAIEAMGKAYAPYSKITVGAALLTKSGKIYTGCNIENASFGATNCAERTAIFKAISEGDYDFDTIAVVGNLDHPISPCGICRQVIQEFSQDMRIILGSPEDFKVYTISDMLPHAFVKKDFDHIKEENNV